MTDIITAARDVVEAFDRSQSDPSVLATAELQTSIDVLRETSPAVAPDDFALLVYQTLSAFKPEALKRLGLDVLLQDADRLTQQRREEKAPAYATPSGPPNDLESSAERVISLWPDFQNGEITADEFDTAIRNMGRAKNSQPSREKLLTVLEALLRWESQMGGWEAPCWKQAKRLLHKK